MASTGIAVADPTPPLSRRREKRSWYFYDWANSAFATTVVTVFLGPYLNAIARRGAGCDTDPDVTCNADVSVFGWHIAPGSLFPYTVSL